MNDNENDVIRDFLVMAASLKGTATLISKWAWDRNLIEGARPKDQFLKVVEEFSEILAADTLDGIIDSIGDGLVTVFILAEQLNINPSILIDKSFAELSSDEGVDYTLASNPLYNLGRIAEQLCRGKQEGLEFYLTNLTACLITAAIEYDLSPSDCLKSAYDEIKDRRGRMVDGIFVKESELN